MKKSTANSTKNANARVDETRREIVGEVVEMMEQGRLDWANALCGNVVPRNYVSERAYRGVNRLRLAHACAKNGWTDPRFMTFNQARENAGGVRKGEHGTVIEKWKEFPIMEEDEEGNKTDKVARVVLRCVGYWVVFNASQTEDPAPLPKRELSDAVQVAEIAEKARRACPCRLVECAVETACYSPKADVVNIYPRQAAESLNGWVRTLLHEEAHATGHESRLARNIRNLFGTPEYAREELVAELSAAFLSAELGLPEVTEHDGQQRRHAENHAAYLQSWLRALKNNPDELFMAASKASQAADYIAAAWAEKPADIAA